MAGWTMERVDEVVLLGRDDGKANTVLSEQFKGLEAALDAAEASGARALVLTGRAGFFSAGLNLKVLPALSPEAKRALVEDMGSAVLKLFLFPRPVVAAVGGHALGAGAMFALAADVRIFADGPYKFGLNEVPAGLFVPSYAIELARAAVSASRLTELVVHGRVLSPMEALTMHVAEAVHSPEALRAAALLRARSLAELSGPGYAVTKRLLRGPGAEVARARLPAELAELAKLLG
jgi:enoyl-CoA hydratase